MSDSPSSRGGVVPPARRKSVLVRSAAHAAQTLPRGFVMPSAPEALDAGASGSSSSSSSSSGGIGLRATPTVSTNASVTAAVQRAQASARSTGGSSSPRSQSPASAGGTRRLNTGGAAAAKGAGESAAPVSKPPVPMFDAASDPAPGTTPRLRKSMSAAVTTPVAVASPTTPSRLSGGFSGAKARLSISRGYATLGRQSSISIAAGLSLPRNADDDSPTTPTLGQRSRTHSNASLHLPGAGGIVATPTSENRRVSFGPRPSTASRPSIIGGQGINLLSPDMSHSGAAHRRSMSTLSSANLSPSSYASSAPFDGPVVPYNAEDFVSAKSLSDSANSDNICVVVRCRPFIKEETARGVDTTKKSVVLSSDSVSCIWKGEARKFTYDHVFGDESTQRSVYLECAGSIVHQALQGYNATIFAYGQTGSGKTHSMLGEVEENSEKNGIIPRAVDHIFSFIRSQHADAPIDDEEAALNAKIVSNTLGEVQFLISLSFLEIYNEHVHDLLSFTSGARVNLDVREDVSTGGFHVPNLSRHIVTNRAELIRLIESGSKNRSVTSTIMNEASSRSHSMMTISVEKSYRRNPDAAPTDEEILTGESADANLLVQSKLNLVDLAGSERLTTSAAEKTGKETMAINLSLSTLANVIAALTSATGAKVHVPYRDSKLTRLLKDSLGGNAKTLMIACINPADSCLPETVSTLRYASRAKQIQNKAKINEDPRDAILRALHSEIEALKKSLFERSKLTMRMFHLVSDLGPSDTIAPSAAAATESPMLSPGSEQKLLMPAAGAAEEASNGADGGATTTTMTTITTTVTATAASTTTTVMSSPSPPMSSASPPVNEATSPAAASDQTGVASPVASASSRLSSPVNAVSVSHQQVQLRIDSSSDSVSASNAGGVGGGAWDNLAQASPTQFLAALQANSNLLSARALDRFKADAQADLEMVEADKEAAGGAALALADSTVSLETLPASSFYALFKSHVLKMYMSLMQAQHDLEQKEMVCARALERVRCLEDVINDVRLREKEEEKEDEKEAEAEASAAAAAAAVSKAAAPALENSLSPPEVSPAPALSPFSPTSPSSVLEEATARLRETSRRSSGVLGSPSTPSKDAAVTPGGRPAHSRRSSVGIDALLQSRSSRTASTLNSPRAGGPGDVMGSATPAGMDGSGLFTPMGDESATKFSVEAQRILQLQQTIEDLRAQTEAAEEKLAASRADVSKARAEAEARVRAQLNAAQDEALDRARRVEELETEVERHRLQELQWADLLMQHHKAQPHAAKLADAMAVARAGSSPIVVVSPPGADGTPSVNASATPGSSSSGGDPIASPASYNLSALSSPNSYLLSDPMRTPPVDSAPLQVTPVTIESATALADDAATGAASPAFALPTFDSRVSYLRSVLDTANRSAAAIPQLHDLLQQSAARLAEMEQRPAQQRPAAGAGPDSGADDRDAQLAAAREREEKLNRRIAELSGELAHVHDQHELQLSPLRAELAAAPVFDFAFSSGPPSAVSSPRPPAAAAAAASGSSSSAAISNPNFGSVPLPLSTNSPSHEWLQQTIQLQNSILELSAEIQQLRSSKRDLVKHSSQELKRMRAEVMQLRGLPVPDESAAAAAAPTANSAAASASAAQADKTCVLQ